MVHAHDPEISLVTAQRIIRRYNLPRRLIVRKQRAYRPRAQFPSETHTVFRVRDATGEDEIDGCIEVGGIFEKERTLFGEENLETLVDRDLRFIGLDLREIGINGCIPV